MPLDKEHDAKWDVDYFLSVELLTFLENFDLIKSASSVLIHVIKNIDRS